MIGLASEKIGLVIFPVDLSRHFPRGYNATKEKSCTGMVFVDASDLSWGFCGPQSLEAGGVGTDWQRSVEHCHRAAWNVWDCVPNTSRWYRGGGQTVLRPNRFSRSETRPNRGAVATPWAAPRRHCPVCPREVGRERSGLCGRDCFPPIFGADGVASGNAVRRMAFARWSTASDSTVSAAGQARFLIRTRAPQGGFDRFPPDRRGCWGKWTSRHFLRPESGVSSRFPWTSAGTVADQVEPTESPECPATRLGHGAGNGGREFCHPLGP
jgi:hypothetical protein